MYAIRFSCKEVLYRDGLVCTPAGRNMWAQSRGGFLSAGICMNDDLKTFSTYDLALDCILAWRNRDIPCWGVWWWEPNTLEIVKIKPFMVKTQRGYKIVA